MRKAGSGMFHVNKDEAVMMACPYVEGSFPNLVLQSASMRANASGSM